MREGERDFDAHGARGWFLSDHIHFRPTQLDFDYGALELIPPTLSYMGRRGVEDAVAGRQLLARETGA